MRRRAGSYVARRVAPERSVPLVKEVLKDRAGRRIQEHVTVPVTSATTVPAPGLVLTIQDEDALRSAAYDASP
ncbi:hypothetical protein GCM10010245_66660 [Streptomyces spectabilis]|uniref:Uncharacterized protein n=1 Tax=Streptomyces spectabilis TaxID=68270 RepID=A0A5P2X4M3_STRST|nr:hypothetical protein CP982_01160 [Streptomyces spectabilis]GGV42493.1 hypothetical protein GCM10010245_66660 [Streptomyces spectabilis]